MSSAAAKFQALAASSKSADRLRNQSMFSHEFSKVLAARAVIRFFGGCVSLTMTSQIIPEALSGDAKSLLRCVLVSVTCKLPLAVEGETSR